MVLAPPPLPHFFDRLEPIDPHSMSTDNSMYSHWSDDWWNKKGQGQGLHMINKTRVDYFSECIRRHLQPLVQSGSTQPVRILDIGCGGGLVTEAIARKMQEWSIQHGIQVDVLGVDLWERSVQVAQQHAIDNRVDNVRYEVASAYDLSSVVPVDHEVDVVIMSDVLEHLHDLRAAMREVRRVLRSERRGIFLFSTLNRTNRSYLMAILLLQDTFRVLPRNMHDWRMFITHWEMRRLLAENGLKPSAFKGLKPRFRNPLDTVEHSFRQLFGDASRYQNQPTGMLGSLFKGFEPSDLFTSIAYMGSATTFF